MSTSSADSIFGFGSTRVVVPVGATVATLITPIAGQNSMQLKYYGGGTLQIIGLQNMTLGQFGNVGSTLTAQQLADAVGNHYLMDTTEKLSIDGPATFYLQALGATTIVMMLIGKTQGT